MPLVKEPRRPGGKILLYSADIDKVVSQHNRAPEEVGTLSRRHHFVRESILCQVGSTENAAAQASGLDAVKETADVTDGSAARAHARGVGNKIRKLQLTGAYVDGRPGALKAQLEIEPPEDDAAGVEQQAAENSGGRSQNI